MPVIRWPGKRTSGRYVYPSLAGDKWRKWYWQCDLHEELNESPGGEAGSMKDALDAALEHAKVCPYTND